MNYFIGIDGGATSTRAVVIDSDGNTLYKKVYNLPSNLSIEFETTSSDILTINDESVKGANIQKYDSLLITNGIHRNEISKIKIDNLIKEYKVKVDYFQTDLKW